MKTTFILVHLILSVGYPTAIVAEMIGVLPASVLNFPAFVGFYVAAGALGIALQDYSRGGSRGSRRVNRRSPRAENPTPAVASHAESTWGYRTLSA